MGKNVELGKKGEALACGFLEAKGMHILDRNYRFQKAEIDIVALQLDPAELIFVEVKSRSGQPINPPENAISPTKQKLIFKVADSYIYEKQMGNVPARFDIIAISQIETDHPLIHHIEDAFRLNGSLW